MYAFLQCGHEMFVFYRRPHRNAQAIGQRQMRAIQTLNQRSTFFQPFKYPGRMRHMEQDKIRLTRIGSHVNRSDQPPIQPGAIQLDLLGLLLQHIMVLKQFFRHHLRQYAHIIR